MTPPAPLPDPTLVAEALRLTREDREAPRTAVDEARLADRFAAEFVAESESLADHPTTPRQVLDAHRNHVLRLTRTDPA